MLKHASFVMAILLTLVSSRPLISYYTMSISTTDDIHYNTSLVIAVNALQINSSGHILMDDVRCEIFQKWNSQGKRIAVSLQTSQPNFGQVFAHDDIRENAITSLASLIAQTPIGGVQIRIDSFNVSPFLLADFIVALKLAINGGFVVVSARSRSIHLGSDIPLQSAQSFSQSNYLVPIIQKAQQSIDLVIARCQNGWYDNLGDNTRDFLVDTTMQWFNQHSPMCRNIGRVCRPFSTEQFSGIDPQKFAIGMGNEAPQSITIDDLVGFIHWADSNPLLHVSALYSGMSYYEHQTQYIRSNIILTGSKNFFVKQVSSRCRQAQQK